MKMHPVPPAAELQFLIGEEIGQIALDPYSLQFRFADGGQITANGRIEYVDKRGLSHDYNCQKRPSDAIYLHNLLQQTITAINTEPLCLSLSFSNGAILHIFSEIGPYESAQIYPRQQREDCLTMIVF